MQAITTKYMGPTNHRPSRIKATSCGGKTITNAYDGELSTEANHQAAAISLLDSIGWRQEMVGGTLSADGRMAWVSTSRNSLRIDNSH